MHFRRTAAPRRRGRRGRRATVCGVAVGVAVIAGAVGSVTLGLVRPATPAASAASPGSAAPGTAVVAQGRPAPHGDAAGPPGPAKLTVAATRSQLGSWHLIGHTIEASAVADQGVATRGSVPFYRGELSIPLQQRSEGWNHIGDQDARAGFTVDAYQGPAGGRSKMYLVTTPSGASYEYTHVLDAGELYNNSFAAISPDGLFLVSGEWQTITRLIVFPMPGANVAAPAAGGALSRVGDIRLDHPVRDLQGCDFVTATRLLCSSDDPGTDLWRAPRPLLTVDLRHRLDGAAVVGHVTDLGALPQVSACNGTFETEGIDYSPASGILRVEVLPPAPCQLLATVVYAYRSS